jgi:hypothetical protein
MRMATEAIDRIGRAVPRQGRPDNLDRYAKRLRSTVNELGISRTQLVQLLNGPSPAELGALDAMLSGGSAAGRDAVREVLIRLEDRLGANLGSGELCSRLDLVGKHLASVVGGILGVFCCYIIVGGLLAGQSLLLGNGAGPAALLLFMAVLAVLATFEALHVSAAILKIADLGALAERHPRAAALHRRFHTDDGLARFLAGRQLVVVGTVFLCSSMSSFPNMTELPFTSIPVPPQLHPLLVVGMPGALFVLWFGQLAPQFIATRHAVKLTDTRLAGLAFRLAYGFEAAGLARVGFWASAWDTTAERIPFSAALLWKQAAEDVDGVGAVGLIRDWSVDSESAELRATSALRVYKAGSTSITDTSMLVPSAPSSLTLEADARRGDGGAIDLLPTERREEDLAGGDRRFHVPLTSAIGSFRPGDVLRVKLAAKYGSPVWQDIVHVDEPVRFVAFLVRPSCRPREMPPATLRTFEVGDGIGDVTEISAESIEPTDGPDGVPMFSHVVDFPLPKTLFVLEWRVAA